uniref:Peptide chain release factor domain-containing protein n=1 Tax=Oryctolagus cuniculus TaxID=9986 RepID=G1U8U4_RABIT
MRSRFLLGAAWCLWARPWGKLFTRGRPLRTFLKCQARSDAPLQVRRPEGVAATKLLSKKEQELREIEHLLRDENADLRRLAENEQQILLLLVPSEETDENDLVLEVTAGIGGQEAMLFTSEMFDMYQQHVAFKRWHFEPLEYFPSEIGGLRHASASIGGSEAYTLRKFEGGVRGLHRVPKTEKQGRVHTSTMTVAILPQSTEINLVVNPKDLRIDTKRASGAGGQHVNTTDSIVSECQQERSQLKNREMAMKKLCAKLYSMHLEETSKRYNARKIQVGTKGRLEKRTYNFPQNRVTDHRINKSVHDLDAFMKGDYQLDEMIQSLKDYANYESLLEIISKKL